MQKEGVTASALASELGVSLSYMCDITAGRRRLKRNPVLRRQIADALNCRVATICTTEESEPTPPARAVPRQRLDHPREHQLYRLWAADGTLLYIGVSCSAVGRISQHINGTRWWLDVSRVTIENLGNITRATAITREINAIRREKPLHNIVGTFKEEAA